MKTYMIRTTRRMNFKPARTTALEYAVRIGNKIAMPSMFFATLIFMGYNGGALSSPPKRIVLPVAEPSFPEIAKGAVSSMLEKSELIESVKSAENSILITLHSDAIFPIGTARIHSRAKTELQAIAAQLLTLHNIKGVEIEAHTDSSPVIKNIGSFESNWELSSARASHIIPLFQSAGFKNSFLSAVGYGDSRLNGKFKDDPALNRRIVLRVTGGSE